MYLPIIVAMVGVYILDAYFVHERLRRIETNQQSMRSLFNKALQDNIDTVAEVRAMLEKNR